MGEFRLCYVDAPWAWFTSIEPFKDQWGDDWNDAPYDANAGEPYGWRPGDSAQPYQIHKVAFEADLDDPSTGHWNSPYSVQDINSGAIAWLRSPSYVSEKIIVPAGTEYSDFMKLITKAAGVVYVPLEPVFDFADTLAVTQMFPPAREMVAA